MLRIALAAALILSGLAAGAYLLGDADSEAEAAPGPFTPPAKVNGPISITVPTALTARQVWGRLVFNENCALCHGENGVGSISGPPLVHVIYEPSHHGDGAFYNAALNGVRAHHWRFGDMRPVEGVAETEVAAIIDYIRALQRANGVR